MSGEWKPIETAPKDRNVILGSQRQDMFGMPYDRVAFGFWMADMLVPSLGTWCILGGKWKPTHWLDIKLPPVPKERNDD
jgi:hypothetical protein